MPILGARISDSPPKIMTFRQRVDVAYRMACNNHMTPYDCLKQAGSVRNGLSEVTKAGGQRLPINSIMSILMQVRVWRIVALKRFEMLHEQRGAH